MLFKFSKWPPEMYRLEEKEEEDDNVVDANKKKMTIKKKTAANTTKKTTMKTMKTKKIMMRSGGYVALAGCSSETDELRRSLLIARLINTVNIFHIAPYFLLMVRISLLSLRGHRSLWSFSYVFRRGGVSTSWR